MSGTHLRDQGIALVDRNTERAWKDEADTAIMALARSGHPFTAEDVRLRLPDPPKPNAMGARFMHAVRKEWIVKIGYTNASRKSAHARALAQYKGAA